MNPQQIGQQHGDCSHTEIMANSIFPRIPLPTLVEGAIEAYFMSLEFWFAASGVTNDIRKYNTVMAQIPPNKLMELIKIIENVPSTGKYEYVKLELTKHFADSQTRRLQRVLSDMPLGDQKPSQLYYEMVRVAGNTLSESTLRDLWATRLPSHAQAAAVAANGSLMDCLEIADRVHESMNLSANAITPVDSTTPLQSSIHKWMQQIDESIHKISNNVLMNNSNRIRPNYQNHSSPSRSRNSPRRSSPNRTQRSVSDNPNNLCWYHVEFGRYARKCREPCAWIIATTQDSITAPPSSGNNNGKY